jgi:hypothetical protein
LVDKIISPKKMEIAYGQSSTYIDMQILWISIKGNNPKNIIIVRYNQADRVKAAISKKYCSNHVTTPISENEW